MSCLYLFSGYLGAGGILLDLLLCTISSLTFQPVSSGAIENGDGEGHASRTAGVRGEC